MSDQQSDKHSPTPRTDAFINERPAKEFNDQMIGLLIGFARQLERELAEAREILRSMQQDHADELQRVADSARSASVPSVAGYRLIREDVCEFLRGAAPLEGIWYGDAKEDRQGKPPFWWRQYLAAEKLVYDKATRTIKAEPTATPSSAVRSAGDSDLNKLIYGDDANIWLGRLYDAAKHWKEQARIWEQRCREEEKNATQHYTDLQAARSATAPLIAKPRDEWHEDDGNVIWWKFPVNEPPWVGTPLDADWPWVADGIERRDYYTHFTPLVIPANARTPDGTVADG